MESGVRAQSDAARVDISRPQFIAQQAKRPAPARTDHPPIAPAASADDALAALLRYCGEAIACNVACVIANDEPEGPHQLRVALRRLRTVLRMFAPLMRRGLNKRLGGLARDLGGVAGALRDADVVIDDIVAPSLGSCDGSLLASLRAWREDVRARVRAGLLVADTGKFAEGLVRLSETREWRSGPADLDASPATTLASVAMKTAWERAARRGGRIRRLNHCARHELRKDVKAFRYAYEVASALTERSGPTIVPALKRLQSSLGRLNDLALFAALHPPLPDASRRLLEDLRAHLADAHAVAAEAALTDAVGSWRWLAMRQRSLYPLPLAARDGNA